MVLIAMFFAFKKGTTCKMIKVEGIPDNTD